MSGHSIDLPAGTVHYRAVGPVDGRPVVFVHGFLVDHAVWSDVPERLAARGFRCFAPTWPLGSHTTAMNRDADLSPQGVGRVVLTFLEELDLTDAVLVGNDTGGAVCQFAVDQDPSRIGRLVLTDCDAFDTFPPFPFGLLFRLARHPAAARMVLSLMRSARLRTSRLGFGWLVHRRLTAEESRPWVMPYLTDAGVRHDVLTFARAWDPDDLVDVSTRLPDFDKPVLLVWARRDPFFTLALATRLVAIFQDARLVEVDEALTFLALDQPGRLADEIAGFGS